LRKPGPASAGLGSLGIKTGGAMELASHTASLLHS